MTRNNDDDDEGTSRSARKRAAESAQQLGEELIALPEADLDALDLPERLRDAVLEARRIRSRAAGARQRQYIGKLMRAIDCEPIAAALAARSERDALETRRFARAESWRNRLLTEGDVALAALAASYPALQLDTWRTLLTRARAADHGARVAQRELFRALRDLLG
jgi:ribosome-associated protein